MATILVIDDEPNILELAKLYLEKEGYQVQTVSCGRDALSHLSTSKPSLVILDLMLPDIDGFDVCREIRKKSDVPILMLTARRDDIDKVVGLELGADDYLTKPFNPRELSARVKAILRRYQAGKKPGEAIEVGNLHIDPAKREATISNQPIKLRTKEFDLLKAFVQNFGIALTREQLLEIVWDTDYYGETRTVDIHINHLRDKLENSNIAIETLRGVGYKMILKQ